MLNTVPYNSVKHSVYMSGLTLYPNQFRYREIQSPPTCIHEHFTELDSAVYLKHYRSKLSVHTEQEIKYEAQIII